MSNSALANVFGADFYAALRDAGMSDIAVLKQGTVETDCSVIVDRDVQQFIQAGIDFVKDGALVRVLREGLHREVDVIPVRVYLHRRNAE